MVTQTPIHQSSPPKKGWLRASLGERSGKGQHPHKRISGHVSHWLNCYHSNKEMGVETTPQSTGTLILCSAPSANVSFIHICSSTSQWKLTVQFLEGTVRALISLRPFIDLLTGCFVSGLACEPDFASLLFPPPCPILF